MSGDGDPSLPDSIWRTLAERASDGMYVADARHRIEWINGAGCRLVGRERHELVGRPVADLFAEPELPGPAGAAPPATFVRKVHRRDGRDVWFEGTSSDLGDGRVLAIVRDATARIEAQQRLVRSEAGFRAVIDRSPDGIVVHQNGRVFYANPALARMLGYATPADLIDTPALGLVHPDDRQLVLDRVKRLYTGEPALPFTEERLLHRDGSAVHTSIGAVHVEFEGLPCVVAICRDVSEQRRVHAHLVEADRMVALGTLSAGIAHEINNPLTYLLLHLDAIAAAVARLRTMLDGDGLAVVERVTTNVRIAVDGASRVRDIVRDLRVFARTADEQRGPIDIRPAIERAIAMTTHELRQRATVVADLAELPRVVATDGRLTQVFVNLLLNAAHAIGEGGPDRHRVEIRAWREGGEARVSVSDTGGGIDEAHLPHIFDPFFTTKPVGEGAGLGLAIVHGIVTGLGGTVRVHTRPGDGSTFVVALPAHPHPG